MKKIKKILAVLLVTILSVGAVPQSAHAIGNKDDMISPMYVNIHNWDNSFYIQNGLLGATTFVTCGPKASRISLQMQIQKYDSSSGGWNTYRSFSSDRENTYGHYIMEEFYTPRGQYRMMTYVYIYINGVFTEYDWYVSPIVTW